MKRQGVEDREGNKNQAPALFTQGATRKKAAQVTRLSGPR